MLQKETSHCKIDSLLLVVVIPSVSIEKVIVLQKETSHCKIDSLLLVVVIPSVSIEKCWL